MKVLCGFGSVLRSVGRVFRPVAGVVVIQLPFSSPLQHKSVFFSTATTTSSNSSSSSSPLI
eukprot:m.129600 g.129600  ORF g.129600 m.129600 type:complete len:61 (+) comp13048_c0_seq12:46-228(+)